MLSPLVIDQNFQVVKVALAVVAPGTGERLLQACPLSLSFLRHFAGEFSMAGDVLCRVVDGTQENQQVLI